MSEKSKSNRFGALSLIENQNDENLSLNSLKPNYSKSISDSSEESASSSNSNQSNLESSKAEDDSGWQNVGRKKVEKNILKSSSNLSEISNVINEKPTYNSSDSSNSAHIEMVKKLVENNIKTLIILRGCPGSGKSYLAG